MKYFISGGAKNGKSMYAQEVAKKMADEKNLPLYYVATMKPVDEEDENRIKRHIAERDGWGFETLEVPTDINTIGEMDINLGGVFLLDSLTALVANEMFISSTKVNLEAGTKVAQDLELLCKKVENLVVVSDFIYSNSAIFDEYTQKYMKALAKADRTMARLSDKVVEVSFSTKILHKGA